MKGKSQPLAVWQAVGARSRLGIDVDAPAAAPFVGRRRELELLQQLFERCLEESGMQLVTIVGEPGAGKTRLVGELRAWVDERPEIVLWRQGRCLPYGEGIAYWPVGEVGQGAGGDSGVGRPRGHRGEARSDPGGDARSGLAPRPAGAAAWAVRAGGGTREQVFTAWQRFLDEVAARRPLVLIIEDLHWADAAMLAFVEHLAEWSSGRTDHGPVLWRRPAAV